MCQELSTSFQYLLLLWLIFLTLISSLFFITLNGVIVDVNIFVILEAVMSYTSAYFSCLFNL